MIPTTFKEYLQLLYSRFIVAAGVAIGVGVAAIIGFLTFLDWPETLYGQIITILGSLALGGGLTMALIIAFLGLGGPAGSLKLRYKDVELDAQGDE